MRNLLELLQYIYNNLKDKNEIAIYDKYGNNAKRITVMFIRKEKIVIFHYSDYVLILTLKLDTL